LLQRRASASSWVTRISVVPCARFSSSISSMIWLPVAASRLPVGSSANNIFGWTTKARAIATRCCSPPERCFGKCSMRCVKPTRRKASVARSCASGAPCSSSGSITFSSAVNAGSNWNDWNTKPASRPRRRARPSSSKEKISVPSRYPVPLLGASSPASNPSSVDLPEPDAPSIARLSPASTVKLTSCRMISGWASPSIEGLATCLPRLIACTIAAMKTLSSPVLPILKAILLVAALWLPLTAVAAKNILVFGDSLSAGYGIAIEKSWVNLLQQELQRTQSGFSIVNASISGETALGGRQRIAKALRQYRPVIVIVELGANDGLRGFSTADIETNLGDIIEQTKDAGAKVLLVGMKLPPNYGEPYITQFENVYPRLAEKHRVKLLPFLLEGVAAEQFQADNLHPVAEAQQHIMLNVMQELKPVSYTHLTLPTIYSV